jgi:hypothetical protein
MYIIDYTYIIYFIVGWDSYWDHNWISDIPPGIPPINPGWIWRDPGWIPNWIPVGSQWKCQKNVIWGYKWLDSLWTTVDTY